MALGPGGLAEVDIPLTSDRLLPLEVSVVLGSCVVVSKLSGLRVALPELRSLGVAQGP